MAISTLLGQPGNWGKISFISKNIQESHDVHSPIPNSWIYLNYRLGLPLQIPSSSANQSWGTQFQHKETRWNLKNLKALLSNRQNPASMTQSGPTSPWMDSATLPITISFYFLYPLLYWLHTSRFCNTSSTDKATFSFTQLITRKHPAHAPNSRLGLFHKQALNVTMPMHRRKYL